MMCSDNYSSFLTDFEEPHGKKEKKRHEKD